jgi:hypothetical protein
MNSQLIKYAFTQEEINKHGGLLSLLKLTGLKKIIVLVASLVKKITTWVLLTFGITTLSDLYEKAKENPLSALEEENREWKFWRQNEGPFENIFRIATYSMPAFGGLFGGSIALILDKFLSKQGYGIEDFGKYLDKKMGLKAGDDVKLDGSLDNAIAGLFNNVEEKTYDNNMKDLKKLFEV